MIKIRYVGRKAVRHVKIRLKKGNGIRGWESNLSVCDRPEVRPLTFSKRIQVILGGLYK